MPNDTETKAFHVGDILSVTTGVLVSPRHIAGVYEILGWMTGESLMSHQLPRVSRECEPFLRETFPDLAGIDMTAVSIASEAECLTWLASIEPTFGTHREVPRLPEVDHTTIDPIAEIKMVNPSAVILGRDA
jgi:hypothetical protein